MKQEELNTKENFKKKVKKFLNNLPKRSQYNTDDIYEVLIKYVNQERNHCNLIENRWNETKEKNFQANEEISYLRLQLEQKDSVIENLSTLLKTQDLEIQRISKLLDTKDKEQKKLYEYLDKVAEILKNNQQAIMANRKKPTKADFIADGMYKLDPSTKERLK